jgi:cohesin loading factor subunit SCC2
VLELFLFLEFLSTFQQLYSEELITSCLGSIKNQLTNIIYPFVEASGDSGNQTPLLRHLVGNSTPESQRHRRQLSELFQALSAVLPRITNLLCGETIVMSDSIIIQAVYIAIGPFFVETADSKGKKDGAVLSTLGKSALRGLKLDALSLIRSVSNLRRSV